MSLKESIFPSMNKEADVCPIHKKNEKTGVKIIDSFHSSQTLNVNIIRQIMLSIVEQIRSALDKNMFTCGVFIGLEKAFDTFANHDILLDTLNHYVISDVATKWFSSYLSNRHQKVTYNLWSTTGIHLGPLTLFNLHK